ncbi:MAG: DUF2007 domain-containing protein [bacterium]
MPFCPKCRYEYERDVTQCPDCEVDLVEVLPEFAERDRDDDVSSVLLYKTDDYMLAQLLVGALEASDIPCWAKRLGMGRLGSSVTGAITHSVYDVPKTAEIYVHPDDLEQAQEILQGLTEGEVSGDDDEETD